MNPVTGLALGRIVVGRGRRSPSPTCSPAGMGLDLSNAQFALHLPACSEDPRSRLGAVTLARQGHRAAELPWSRMAIDGADAATACLGVQRGVQRPSARTGGLQGSRVGTGASRGAGPSMVTASKPPQRSLTKTTACRRSAVGVTASDFDTSLALCGSTSRPEHHEGDQAHHDDHRAQRDRRAGAGRRWRRAPRRRPSPTPMSAHDRQSTSATTTNSSPATALTTPASTFLTRVEPLQGLLRPRCP